MKDPAAFANVGALSAFLALAAPAARAADTPPEYTCTLMGNGTTLALTMRLGPGHVSSIMEDSWSHNMCDEPKAACSVDDQGRIVGSGEGKDTGAIGALLFDPVSGVISVTLRTTGAPIVINGMCRRNDVEPA